MIGPVSPGKFWSDIPDRTELADVDVTLDILDRISHKLDGKPAAANPIARKRAVLGNVLDYAVGRGLDINALPQATKMRTKPKTTEGVVDRGGWSTEGGGQPRGVVNRGGWSTEGGGQP
ncbi:MAG: hypothetical protein ABSF03_10515, partial [Streptosporangiaceae bacterium]